MDYKEILIKDASISWLCSVWFLLRGETNWSASKKDELKMTYYVLVKLQAFINFSPLDDWWQLGDPYYHSFDGIQPAISATLVVIKILIIWYFDNQDQSTVVH